MGVQKYGAEDIGCVEVMTADWLTGRVRGERFSGLESIRRRSSVMVFDRFLP